MLATTPSEIPAVGVAVAVPIPLSDLRPGAIATLHDVRVDPQARSVLRSLGLIDSCRLRLCKLGDPCIVQVRSTRIGLSKAVSQRVFVIADPRDHG